MGADWPDVAALPSTGLYMVWLNMAALYGRDGPGEATDAGSRRSAARSTGGFMRPVCPAPDGTGRACSAYVDNHPEGCTGSYAVSGGRGRL